MRGLLSLCCVAVLLYPVCAQDPTKDGLYPLKIGAKWTYKSGTDTIEVVVKKTEKLNKDDKGEAEAFVLETSIAGATVASEHIAVRTDGLYRVKVGGVLVTPPVQFLKLPAKKDESWAINSRVGPEKLEGKFTTGESEVEWNKEKKKAITVSGPDMMANGQKLSVTYTFVEGVGLFAQTASLANIQVKLDLVKYEPSKE